MVKLQQNQRKNSMGLFDDDLARYGGGAGGSGSIESAEPFNIDKNVTLKKDDLLKGQHFSPIKQYMIERKGVDYADKPNEQVVDDFVEHMRFFNTNVVSTAGEARFVAKATPKQKAIANKAYQTYDQLGNVFVNDGFFGAVKGVGQYIEAAAKDPTNYIGIATGGLAKLGAAGTQLGGKEVVKAAVRAAGRNSIKDGLTKTAAKNKANEAAVEAASRFVAAGASTKSAGKVFQKVAKEGNYLFRKAAFETARKDAQEELFKSATKKGLVAATISDAAFAVFQDVEYQNIMLDVGAQEEYSAMQTGFASAFGAVGGGAALAATKFKGKSGLTTIAPSDKVTKELLEKYKVPMSKADGTKLSKQLASDVSDWATKVQQGTELSQAGMPVDLVKSIIFGTDGKGGLAKAYKDLGIPMRDEKNISDYMTNIAMLMPEQELARINKVIEPLAGFTLGEMADNKTIASVLARTMSDSGKNLNVAGQFKKMVNSGLMSTDAKVNQLVDESNKIIAGEVDKLSSNKLAYTQSVWKRLLVSSPQTTALNVVGFGSFAIGQTMADIFNGGRYMALGLAQGGRSTLKGAETLRKGQVLFQLQHQKMKNFLDPYTTYDAYMSVLDSNPEISKKLMQTITGGVEATSEKYKIDPNSGTYKLVEAVTTAANQLTGVRIQDSFTKSQMYMSELDKAIRLNNGGRLAEIYPEGTTLKQVLQDGNIELIDETMSNTALGTTLESVFSKNYTVAAKDSGMTGELLSKSANFVETLSNTPLLGTIMPFGRFFNNVVASSYKWSPLAYGGVGLRMMSKIAKRSKKEGIDIAEGDAFARATVGTAFLYTIAEADKERREKGLAYYEIEGDAGTVIDVKNTFPLSMYLAIGRQVRLRLDGEPVPSELQLDSLAQLAVGQLAKDAQFGNDLLNIMDVISNAGVEGARGPDYKAIGKVTGNIIAGFTRPLDAINRTVGFVLDNDVAKDVRQAESGGAVFTQSSAKYLDNIVEAFIGKTETLTGKELRVATREGQVYDANPFARLFGVNVKQGRTATEKAYSMAEMHAWKASERTKMPIYDRMLNEVIAPTLERNTQTLISSSKFKKAGLTERRSMLKSMLREVKKSARSDVEAGTEGANGQRLRLANLASKKGNKELRREAMGFMKRVYKIDSPIEDFSFTELDIFIDFVDLLEDSYQL